MKRKARGTGRKTREAPAEYRTPRRLSATEASRNFSDILNRALYRGESFIIERGGEPICEIRPAALSRFTVGDFVSLLSNLPPVDEDFLSEVEAISLSQPSIPSSPWEP